MSSDTVENKSPKAAVLTTIKNLWPPHTSLIIFCTLARTPEL
ncbi:hypothetical protein [Mycobacteroides abscessus]|nr:hypothetical protein [Mycobacteroides abscessus]